MKAIPLTTAIATLGFAVLPLHADNTAATEPTKPVVETAVAKTIGVYIIKISGKG